MRESRLWISACLPLVCFMVAMLAGCSTQKNTAGSRWWHAFNARYNTYYNATLAYIEGSKEKETGNKDNYTERIPLYAVGNKGSKELGAANFDRAIEKCQKAIQLHSIKRRPVWDRNRKKTPKDIEWLNRKEYNPFLWKAWLLMGRAQFHKGDFEGAASTFSYMERLYATQPAIRDRARAWLAKCYTELEWYYDAEQVIRDSRRDSIHWRARKEWDYTLADYYIRQEDHEQAVAYLRKVIKHEMRRKQKAREYFLLGQLLAAQGERREAYRAFRSVLRQHPPYELAFNARIAMTEVAASGNAKSTLRRLRRMAASDNNKEYLDQVYYAMGNVYLAERDTASAIAAYEAGNEKATRSGVEKGVLLSRLGDLYWEKERFGDARRCYGEALGLLDTDRDDYEELSFRSKVLDELVPHTETIHLQDSLQALARMPEAERNAAIDRVIEELKREEKEERDRQAELESQQIVAQNQTGAFQRPRQPQPAIQQGASTTWYFYNPMAVQQGKATFQRQWGKRENVDNWQRSNVTVVAQDAQEEGASEPEAEEETAEEQNAGEGQAGNPATDPHSREYYLAQIPFTEEQKQASDQLLEEALYQAGVIIKDKLDMLPLAARLLNRLVEQYPSCAQADDAYYHLFLLYSRQADEAHARHCLDILSRRFPRSEWTALLTDPYFEESARKGARMEDSLYAATYEAFREGRYQEVDANARLSAVRFLKGANRDKFLFVGGLSQLYQGNVDSCLAGMKAVVEGYPDSRLSEMAGMIINGVNAGKTPRGGRFDLADVWTYRSMSATGQDTARVREFSAEADAPFLFVLVYQPDSTNENQLLFEVAKFNFTTYLARGFDIVIEPVQGVHRMRLSGFRDFQEARQYAQAIYGQPRIMRLLGKGRAFVISEENLALIGEWKTYEDYERFYAGRFAALRPVEERLLLEPEVIVPERTPEGEGIGLPFGEREESAASGQSADDGMFVVPEEAPVRVPPAESLEVPVDEEPAATDSPSGLEIPVEPPSAEPSGEGLLVPMEVPAEPAGTNAPADSGDSLVIPEDSAGQPARPSAEASQGGTGDVEIYFEDDSNVFAGSPQPNEPLPSGGFDLDDEYYDLEGF
jgi:tetratricopeptide (TPR) repeat protein